MSTDERGARDEAPRVSREGVGHRFLPTGTFLHIYCPHCQADLLEERRVHLFIVSARGLEGVLRLSPRFNVFDKESTVDLEPGTEIRDLRCPRCDTSIVHRDLECEWCQAPIARVHVSAVRLEFDLYLCTRVGCHWHGVSEEDRQRVSLDEPPGRSDAAPPDA
ncbi:MAG: hypothetical protein GF330_01160 [Candidatus Eisenbacteria bacterium]|nr:hypothetical protein [Candidatus Eisenbacteria bacterium]